MPAAPPTASTTLPASAEVVVVGAGIAGLCTALYVARSDREVFVLERGESRGESSGANAGTLSLQVKRPEVLELMQLSLDLREGLAVDSGTEIPRAARCSMIPGYPTDTADGRRP